MTAGATTARDRARLIREGLAAEGYGLRAIAPVVGTSHVTVKNDLDSSVKDFTDEHPAPGTTSPRRRHHHEHQPNPS